ncbi:MAG TPA: 16S rRNA (cytosine(1402)-N(4))-methyltransferase RsmH [Candidatus Omnitrophota bacterium]|nr:16S rRNA (cytosine(1402)-N(4))-methyltransferase RsmH [Candidatus Omnitrophota bacterium]
MTEQIHTPVMLEEVLAYLDLRPGKVIVDATVGMGGHALEIVKRIAPTGRLIAIDRDKESLGLAQERLKDYSGIVEFVYGNFSDIQEIVKRLNVSAIDGIVLDLGVSMFQLMQPDRGFSFTREGPLDMRLDRNSYISAYDLVNNLNEDEISNLLWSFGQERWHNRIARRLVEERQKHPITTTAELSDIVMHAIPPRFRKFHYRIHPATRTFQAVRIAVNRELEALEQVLARTLPLLAPGGRICVIAFHSLEDRVVKWAFRKAAAAGTVRILTPKPLTPQEAQVRANPSSRSSKFRAAEKI